MTDPIRTARTRLKAQMEALERLRDQPAAETVADDDTPERFHAIMERVFADLDARDAGAASPAPAFDAGSAPVSRVMRQGIAMIRFTAEILRTGGEGGTAALAGLRGYRDDGNDDDAPERDMTWKPGLLQERRAGRPGDWTLLLDHRSHEGPQSAPPVDLHVDGQKLERDSFEVDHDRGKGQIKVHFALEGEPGLIEVSEDLPDRLRIDVLTMD